jgi:hypothetical protein
MFYFRARHAGVTGNERADRLAGMMVVAQGGIAMGCTDIYNVIRENWRVSKAANDSKSATMTRMNELHDKAGRARQQQYAADKEKNYKLALPRMMISCWPTCTFDTSGRT